MVAGLSLVGWSKDHTDHIPLAQGDLEAGSFPGAQSGNTPPACGKSREPAAVAGTHDAEESAELGGRAGGSPAGVPDKDACSLMRDNGPEDGDVAERARVWRKLSWAILLCLLFMGVEVAGGVVSNSLAILTDAAHLLSDVAGFALSLFALWAVGWRPSRQHSFGYQRMEILGALASVLMTWAITAVIVVEAVNRLLYRSDEVNGRVMFVTAAFGVMVNVAMAVLLSEHHSHGLPGQACTGHAHSHSHSHTGKDTSSPHKRTHNGFKPLEDVDEKDNLVELGNMALPAVGSEGTAVAQTLVATHHMNKGQESGGQHSHGDHKHEDGAPHSPHHLTPDSDAVQRKSIETQGGQVDDGHPQSSHSAPQCGGQRHAHNHVEHDKEHAHSHAHHNHSCSHSGSQGGELKEATGASESFEPCEADALTSLVSPLQLLSDAPAYLVGRLDLSASVVLGLGGDSVPAEGECGRAHGRVRQQQQNINLRGAFVHVMGDLVQSVGVMVAGAIIWARPDWRAVDLGCTFLFSALVVATTVKMVRDIAEILMEATPHDVDTAALEERLRQLDGVQGVHHLHCWALSVGKNALACHLAAKEGTDTRKVLQDASALCSLTFKIEHVTIQIETSV